jgi:hypothetical protein
MMTLLGHEVAMLVTILITTFLVSFVVLIHFEALQLLSKRMQTHLVRPRSGFTVWCVRPNACP